MTLRLFHASLLSAELFPQFVQNLADKIDQPGSDRYEIVREVLTDIYAGLGGGRGAESNSLAAQVARATLDPRHATMEAEYYPEIDLEKWDRVKPLLWFWQMFDRSPVGRNVELGTQMRTMLARRIFKKCGENLRVFHDVEFSFGYNVSLGDNVTIHRNVLIDDRGEVVVGNNVSISDFVNIFSHAHAVEDIDDVSLGRTVIGDNTRLTYHATVFSGVRIGKDAMIGAHGVVNKDVPDGEIFGGVPARKIGEKWAGRSGVAR